MAWILSSKGNTRTLSQSQFFRTGNQPSLLAPFVTAEPQISIKTCRLLRDGQRMSHATMDQMSKLADATTRLKRLSGLALSLELAVDFDHASWLTERRMPGGIFLMLGLSKNGFIDRSTVLDHIFRH